MTKEQSVLLALIRSSLWGEPRPENAADALEQAKIQALVPLIYPDSKEAMQYSAHCIRILFAQDEILALMTSAKIPMAILKGCAAALYYPEPLLRTMGDIDFIVPPERFQEAERLMLDNGFIEAHEPHETDEPERHVAYQKGGITVELHHHFSSDGIDIERYVQTGLTRAERANVGGHEFCLLPPLANGLVLLAHAAQHLKKDLGLRQVIDWMLYVHEVLTDEMWEREFCAAAEACGLKTLALIMTRMCQMYLGLPETITWCREADKQVAEELIENLLATGNFGHRFGSGSKVEKVSTSIKRYGLLRYLQMAGEWNWKAYHRHRWLRPLCWLYQIFRYAHQGLQTGRGRKQISDDLHRSTARYELLTRLGIN